MKLLTINEVIEAGRTIDKPIFHMNWLLYPMVTVLLIVCVVLLIGFFWRGTSLNVKESLVRIVPVTALLYLLLAGLQGMYIYNQSEQVFSQKVSAWKKDIAGVYIDQIPGESKDILSIDFDPYFAKNPISSREGIPITSSDRLHEWTDQQQDHMKLIGVTYMDGPVTTQYDYFEIKRDLKPNSNSYLEVKAVSRYLGFDLEAGNYNSVIHLPSDYRFEK